MGGVVHFEIHADDVERAKAFYGAMFGWTFDRFEGSPTEYWLINVGDETQGGGIMKREGPAPAPGTSPASFVCTMMVESVDEALVRGVQAGGHVAAEKYVIPGMGWGAYLLDTESNLFGVFRGDPNAQ